MYYKTNRFKELWFQKLSCFRKETTTSRVNHRKQSTCLPFVIELYLEINRLYLVLDYIVIQGRKAL